MQAQYLRESGLCPGSIVAVAVGLNNWVSSRDRIFAVWENHFWLVQQWSTADKNLSATKEPSSTRKQEHRAVTVLQHEQQGCTLWLRALTFNEYYWNTLTHVQAAWTWSLPLEGSCWCYLDAAQIMTSSTYTWLDMIEGQPFGKDKTKWTPQWKLQLVVK